jgi:RNA polymerase sigma-70 factor, ECF subfamily
MTAEELETLVRQHEAEVFRYIRYLGAENVSTAEDLVQDTFLAAYKSSHPPLNNDPRVFSAWLRGIARNLFLMHCRRARTNPVKTDSATLERAETAWTNVFLRDGDGFDYVEALRKCMPNLAERQRKVLEMQYAQNKSRAEMATLCKMTEDGIKSLMRRTRADLAGCIKRRLGLAE